MGGGDMKKGGGGGGGGDQKKVSYNQGHLLKSRYAHSDAWQ